MTDLLALKERHAALAEAGAEHYTRLAVLEQALAAMPTATIADRDAWDDANHEVVTVRGEVLEMAERRDDLAERIRLLQQTPEQAQAAADAYDTRMDRWAEQNDLHDHDTDDDED